MTSSRQSEREPIQWYEDPEDGLACYSSPIRNYVYAQSDDDPNYWVAVRWKTPQEMAAEEAAEKVAQARLEARKKAAAAGDKRRTALYRLSDSAGQLLYVGISAKPLQRWTQHAAEKPWWPLVSTMTLEWFDSNAEALAMEALAIQSEWPQHNVVHNGQAAQ
ncbi:GIY-YIG nuclease family protein [Streptomyces sp. NPDC001276]|uniref:GIY-YIG nuclease family protein n=1 Tax=Streptomyces sp. NPDC001276 TaxID=3364555 RepID=UPI0036B1900A